MELTVYRQSSKTRPDGTVVYKGEDALPYVDGQLIMAADGLGGAAAIRHQKIAPELFSEDKLLDTLFNGVYNDYNNDILVKYVTDSFFELFAVKDCYTDNVNNIKKSGYFASRIVTAILLHDFLTNPVFKPEVFFDALAKEENEDERKKALGRLGDYFSDKIRSDLRSIAKNANLVYESSYSGLALLGTTLCAAYYHELKDAVEAIYITAGDSRPYVWNVTDGLSQIVADEEGDDGGMTNYIKANDDESFRINCRYMRFNKPCVLFCASDGCFDSGYFIAPMAFEKLLLETACKCVSEEEMGKQLTEFFTEYGRHDDSSTIAMKFFGYRDFSAFRNEAQKRLDVIKKEYISKMPDLLENDYISDSEKSPDEKKKMYTEIKESLNGSKAVQNFCCTAVRDSALADMQDSDELKAAKEAAEKAVAPLADEIRRNYAEYLMRAPEGSGFDTKSAEQVAEMGEGCRVQFESYIKQLEQHKNSVGETAKQLNSLIEQISGIGVPDSIDDYRAVTFSELKSCEASMNSTLDFLVSLKEGSNISINNMLKRKDEYLRQNRKLAEKSENQLDRLCELVIDGTVPASEEAAAMVKAVKDSREKVKELSDKSAAEAVAKAAAEYWNSNGAAIVEKAANGNITGIPEDVAAEINSALEAAASEDSETAEKAKLQRELFGKYNKNYSKYMRGDE
ncbi:MAG: hypothetical protein IKH75_15660 [Ruminococcus sp.]|nr:hypothetical protein [Ruminococcus sp.]